MVNRELQRTIESVDTSDGAGVKLRRSLGSVPGLYLDPFLMLDEFSSDDAADYSCRVRCLIRASAPNPYAQELYGGSHLHDLES